ncbi:hypothetical protein [Burkholderia sp. BCC0044]|uniref:hypothetical protein n=1 Tax=Burkholderia sp. BCC0044 TaxID=2676295 RepID=UPI00158C4A10|nr:hypothetical protein [Burkholderia sp. BCC0044]
MIAAFRLLPRMMLAASLTVGAVAASSEPVDSQSDSRAVVGVFPSQQWASLGKPAEAAVPPGPSGRPDDESFDSGPATDPEPVAPPFTLTGEWHDGAQRVLVLDDGFVLRLLCERRCDVRGAVAPGEQISDGYRLKRVTEHGALIADAAGTEFTLPLQVATP